MPDNKITLKLYDYLTSKCIYKGCKHNSDGLCSANNIEHLDYIARIVDYSLNKDTGILKNQNIVCSQLDVKEGHCETCGERLNEIHERHPLGDGFATLVLYECTNPKCK